MKRGVVFALALLVACGQAKPRSEAGADAPGTAAAAAVSDTVLALERTPCFGFCPVYELIIGSDGRGVLAGRAPTATFRRAVQVSPEAVRALADQMEQGGFLTMDSAYIPGHPLCSMPATDHPGAVITLWRGGQRHQIRHYHGCYAQVPADGPPQPAPELARLRVWEDAIDSLADVGRWVDSLRGR